MADEALDARAQCIDFLVNRMLHFAGSFGRDLGRRAAIAQVLANGIAVVALVCEHHTRITVPLFHQQIIGRDVVRLAHTQHRPDGAAEGVAADMDFTRKSTP